MASQSIRAINANTKKLFIISPIGSSNSPTRTRSDQIKKHAIDPIANEFGYDSIRADRIYEPGDIPKQIIDHLENDELVLADLSDRNPNVFYELAIRHATRKPVILICHTKDTAPFDVSTQRIMFYDHQDLDSVEDLKRDLREVFSLISSGKFEYTPPVQLQSLHEITQKNNELVEYKQTTLTQKKQILFLENEKQNLERRLKEQIQKQVEQTSILNEKKIQIGYLATTTESLKTAMPFIKEIIEPDLNQYLNNLGYDTEIEFLIDDARGQAAVHLEKVQKFHSMGINLIIGGGWSSQAQASLSYCNQNDILLFSSSSTSPLLGISDDNLFRMCPTDLVQAPAISEMIWSKGIEAIVIIQRADAWADGIYNSFSESYTSKGGVILERIRYAGEATEFSNYLQTAENIVSDAINEYGLEKVGIEIISFHEFVTMITQAHDYPTLYNLPWFGSDGTVLTQQAVDDAPEQANKLKIYSTFATPTISSKFHELYERYYSLLSQPLGYYNACLYDIAMVITNAILQTQSTDTSIIVQNLLPLCASTFGVSGWCELNQDGDRARTDYQIWAYNRTNNGPVQSEVFGLYNGTTEEVTWYK